MKSLRVAFIFVCSSMVSAAPTQGTPDLRVTNVLPHRAHQSSALRSGNSRVPFQRQIVEEVHGIPKPYDFGYNIQDEYGNNQFRQESSNSQGVVKGSYGYTDAFGLHRRVEYVADENGFRADVKSNEPGVKGDQPASARFTVEEVPRVLSTGNNLHQRHHDHPESASLRLKTIPSVRVVPANPRTKQ